MKLEIASKWYSKPLYRRIWIRVFLFCVLLEVALRSARIDDEVHFYNSPYFGLKRIYFFEGCYPSYQLLRLAILRQALRDFHNVAEKHDLRYWIDHGTLLGCLRDGDLIPWDVDADIAVVKEEYEKKEVAVKQDLEKLGYLFEARPGLYREIIWSGKGHIGKIDLFHMTYRAWDNFYTRLGTVEEHIYHFPARHIANTTLVECAGGLLRTPVDAWEMILKWRYPTASYVVLPQKIWCYFTSVRLFLCLLAMIVFIVIPTIALMMCCCKYI